MKGTIKKKKDKDLREALGFKKSSEPVWIQFFDSASILAICTKEPNENHPNLLNYIFM